MAFLAKIKTLVVPIVLLKACVGLLMTARAIKRSVQQPCGWAWCNTAGQDRRKVSFAFFRGRLIRQRTSLCVAVKTAGGLYWIVPPKKGAISKRCGFCLCANQRVGSLRERGERRQKEELQQRLLRGHLRTQHKGRKTHCRSTIFTDTLINKQRTQQQGQSRKSEAMGDARTRRKREGIAFERA